MRSREQELLAVLEEYKTEGKNLIPQALYERIRQEHPNLTSSNIAYVVWQVTGTKIDVLSLSHERDNTKERKEL